MTNQLSSIQEQGRKQRARYKLFYILTKAMLLAGLLSINFLLTPSLIKSKGLISLLVFAVFFALQVVLLSEGFGQKFFRFINAVVIMDVLYVIHLLAHVIFDWLNSALVRSANFQADLLVPQVVLPTLFCLIGLFSLALVWRWWRSFRKSQA